MTKKILALLLALLTIMPLAAACSGDTDVNSGNDTTAADAAGDAVETDEVQGEVPRSQTPDDLPDLDFDGQTVKIYHLDEERRVNYQLIGENHGGDVLFDAVYERNETVKDRLNVDIVFAAAPSSVTGSKLLHAEIGKNVMAGDSDWGDVIFHSAQFGFSGTMVGYYADLMDMPYVNVDQPWWWTDYMEEQSIDTNRRYMLNGDLTLHALMSATAAYFNKEIFTNVNGDIEQLYKLVEDGAWTFEKFLEYCAGAYADVNGDGVRDDDDRFGVYHTGIFEGVNYATLSCGLPMYKRNSDGLPELDVYNENWITWSGYLYDYMMTDEYSRIPTDKKSNVENFTAGKSLFMMDMLFSADKLRDTEFDYGIVPYPKFDEDHNYLSAGATPNADAIMIPITTPTDKYEVIGATIEAMCAETYRSVTEVYYETTLKGKYLGAERDIQMVDIIYKNIGTNFVMVAGVELGEGAISSMFVYVVRDNDGNLASYYDSNKVKFEEYMNGMMEKYNALG